MQIIHSYYGWNKERVFLVALRSRSWKKILKIIKYASHCVSMRNIDDFVQRRIFLDSLMI